MKHRTLGLSGILMVAAILILIVIISGCAATPTPTVSPVPTETATATPSVTPTPSVSPSVTPSPSITATPSPSPTVVLPAVYILSPLYNVSISPGDVTVTVKVSHFDIVNKIGQANVPGEGHFIYYLDTIPPTTAGKAATTAAGTYFETADTSYTWKNVTAGTHTFYVQLVNNDGTPLNPPILASEPVPVVTPTPSPSVSATPSPTSTP